MARGQSLCGRGRRGSPSAVRTLCTPLLCRAVQCCEVPSLLQWKCICQACRTNVCEGMVPLQHAGGAAMPDALTSCACPVLLLTCAGSKRDALPVSRVQPMGPSHQQQLQQRRETTSQPRPSLQDREVPAAETGTDKQQK